MHPIRIFVLVFCLVFFAPVVAGAEGSSQEMEQARQAMIEALDKTGTPEDQSDLLVLTNAGHTHLDGQSTVKFLDIAGNLSGCSKGQQNLLSVQSSPDEPIWGSVYRRDTNEMVFFQWKGGGFESQQIDADPDKVLTRKGWQAVSDGLIGDNAFSVLSISLTWAVDPEWDLLNAATLHDHFCPGLNSGYIAGRFLMDNLPLKEDQEYVFAVAPAMCAADALQVMFNATPGKKDLFTMQTPGDILGSYEEEGVRPFLVAMRVHDNEDKTTGKVLGFDWEQVHQDTGVSQDELRPEEGPKDPMFWVARAKMSRELARMPVQELQKYIVELHSFSGDAQMADKVTRGDPYSQAWNK